jgi:hypothetical protein
VAENETKPSATSPTTYVEAIEDESRRSDCTKLLDLMGRVTKLAAVMWGPAIVGFQVRNDALGGGKVSDIFSVNFSSRKGDISISTTRKYTVPAVKRFAKSTPEVDAGKSPGALIDQRIAELPGWRGELLAQLRSLIKATDPDITEDWKWNTPVWSCYGIICTGESYKMAVKLTFAKGAALADPSKLFNSSLEGNVRRAIDFAEGQVVDTAALLALVQAAVAFNKANAVGKPENAT